MPGDSKDLIRRIIIAMHCSGFAILFIFMEINQDTLYHKLNIRRLGLTLIPKLMMTKTFIYPYGDPRMLISLENTDLYIIYIYY